MRMPLLTLALLALATSTPLNTRSINHLAFSITDFALRCSPTCHYSFNVTTSGMAQNYHNVTTPFLCRGTAGGSGYRECFAATYNKRQTIHAYITTADVLKLEYVYLMPIEENAYYYFGNKTVRSTTGGKPGTKSDLVVRITSESEIHST